MELNQEQTVSSNVAGAEVQRSTFFRKEAIAKRVSQNPAKQVRLGAPRNYGIKQCGGGEVSEPGFRLLEPLVLV